MTKICIDPGHGGMDPGAVGPTGLKEKDIVFDIATRLGKILTANGINIKYTRKTDIFVGLSERAAIANKWGADYFVSVHCNAATSRSAGGTETYHYAGSAKGKALANCIQTELVNTLKLTNRGIKTANFAVLRETSMPAVLAEVAFISNPAEEKKLADPAFRQKAAEAIARGICKYLGIGFKAPVPAPTGKLYKVQVGAFSSKANADALSQKAKKAGFDNFIKLQDGLYKVQVGAFSSKANANALLQKLKKSGFDGFIKEE